jgi:hypothetical protein
MEGNTDFKVGTTVMTAIFEVELTVVADNVCMGVNRAEVSMPPTMEEDVPILTPAGMIALTRYVVHRQRGQDRKKR